MIFFFFKKHESTKFFLNILIEENVPCKVQARIQFINSDNLVVNLYFKECIQIISPVPGGLLLGLVFSCLPGPSREQRRLSANARGYHCCKAGAAQEVISLM